MQQSTDTSIADNQILIRESMLKLPKVLQPFLTWLTAKSVSGEVIVHQNNFFHFFGTILNLIGGLCLSTAFIIKKEYVFLAFSFLITVSAMRKLQVVIYHHCAHNNLFKWKKVDFYIGEMISILLFIKDFKTYQKDHQLHHRAQGLLTEDDETLQDLVQLGLYPGLNKRKLYQKLTVSFVSPIVHIKLFLLRLRATFYSPYWLHNIVSVTAWSCALAVVNEFDAWKFFLIAYLFPVTILYHISRTLRLIVEHTWPNEQFFQNRNRDFIAAATVAVFCGEAFPCVGKNPYKRLAASTLWLFKMGTIHLFSRLFVLVGDTPCHDFHHRNPSSKEWMNYIAARELDKNRVEDLAQQPYQEIWGFYKALDVNLTAMSQARSYLCNRIEN